MSVEHIDDDRSNYETGGKLKLFKPSANLDGREQLLNEMNFLRIDDKVEKFDLNFFNKNASVQNYLNNGSEMTR